tara:strand:- start:435 stop:920 length:486 start_codon:yes stop_codon:yes gene_type:complete
MKILVTGGAGKLATQLKKYITADFLSKEQLDLTSKEQISQLPKYDVLIHTAKGSINISLNLTLLIDTVQPKKIFAFTSRQGTYLNWKQNTELNYGLEKLILNFTIYRHNLNKANSHLIEPGHMETVEHYNVIAKKFVNYLNCNNYKKNMIYDLYNDRFLAF